MNPRTLRVLEYDKILARVAEFCAFSGGEDLALALLPSDDLLTVQEWLAQTSEAYKLLDQKTDLGFGGVHDVRPLLDRAERRAQLLAQELVDIRSTLIRARTIH